MRKRFSLAGLALIIALAIGAPAARAEGLVRVLEDRHSYSFSTKLSFTLVAESDQDIKGVTLYYRRQKERVTSRVTPAFKPGRRVQATFEKILEPGDIPPGTVLEYYWRLDLADGTHSDTPTQSFVYEDDRFAWQTLAAGNLTLLYYGGSHEATQAKSLLQTGQADLERLQSEVGIQLDAPVRIYVYQNSRDMSGALAVRSEGYDERLVTLGVAVADDTLLLLGSQAGIQQTIAHELSHIVVGLATKNPYSPVPRWLDEGLAMHAEGTLPSGYARALNDAIGRDALISVRSLSAYTGDAAQVDLYYGEVQSLVDFLLRTYGRDKMSELLKAFKQGTYQDDALRRVYGMGLDGLDVAWRQSLGLKPRATMAPTTAVASPARTPTPAGRDVPPDRICPAASFVGALGLLVAFGAKAITRLGA